MWRKRFRSYGAIKKIIYVHLRFKKAFFVLFEPLEREPASPIFLRKIIFSLRSKACLIKKYMVLVLRFFADKEGGRRLVVPPLGGLKIISHAEYNIKT